MSGAARHVSTGSAGERGLSLVELLVAMTLLALAMVITLTVYDGAKRSYHRGEIATEQQQIGRIALDLIEQDVRLAGLNLFPDGDHDRPDEPIEAAGERYLVVRADFDGNDRIASTCAEHGDILEAIVARDVALACELIERNINSGLGNVEDALVRLVGRSYLSSTHSVSKGVSP